MIIKLAAAAVVAGVAASLAVSAPALAATAPTLATPAVRAGWGTITLTGTAAPGATVQLFETAIVFNDLEAADDWEHGGGPVTAKADSGGRFEIRRYQDSGFYFQVAADGLRSNKITVPIRVLPTFTLTADGAAHVAADPGQPGLPVQIQRQSGSSWVPVASGVTSDPAAVFNTTVSGNGLYRAYIGADPSNGVLAGYSATRSIGVVAPAPTPPAGSVGFTKIQYNSPGADNGSNTSLNGEWVQVTNKTRATVALRGWTVRDAANHVYTFGSFNLPAGKSVVVHTGKGTNTAAHRYWGRTGYVWNNTGDTATLRTNTGKTVDTCRFGTGKGVTTC
jgi:hypothetical protein